MAREDAGLLEPINDSRYTEFFLASMEVNFRLFFLSLGNLLDKDDRSIGIWKLQNLLKEFGKDDLAKEITKVTKNYQNIIKTIRVIRNKSIAHIDFKEADEIFKMSSATPNEIEALIDAILNALNAIASDFDFPTMISEGKQNEQAARNILEALRIKGMYRIEAFEWIDVHDFFEDHGCVVPGKLEIEWYRAAWDALEKAGLTCSGKLGSFQVEPTTVKLRVLCLMAMYLGTYQAAGGFPKLGGYLESGAPGRNARYREPELLGG